MDNYFEGYRLNDTCYVWDLSEKDKQVLNAGLYLVDNKYSIKRVCKELMMSKSSLHRYLHKRLPSLSWELYACVVRQLKANKSRYFV